MPIFEDYQGKSGVWGGPAEVVDQASLPHLGQEAALLVAQNPISDQPGNEDLSSQAALAMGAVQDPGRVFASVAGTNLLIYKVQPGDTLSGIAQNFGISTQILLASNPEAKSRSLRVGEELTVMPAANLVYQMRPQESLELVAMKHGLTVEQIKEFNRSVTLAGTDEGATLVIPPIPPKPATKEAPGLPSLKGYFVMPTTGFNWGKLHNRNGVDIANSCGTSVVAAQEGLVAAAESEGWNGGYGLYVLVEHPNGTKTRYAHLDKVLVSVGDYVNQREKIGTMGDTGESTGCHLHFEVEGAKNPFVK